MGALSKAAEQDRARVEVELYESAVGRLLSVQKECGDEWDWRALERSPAPAPPKYDAADEQRAVHAVETFRAGFFVRLFRMEESRRRRLSDEVEAARKRDLDRHSSAASDHVQAYAEWEWHNELARGINRGDLGSYEAALTYVSPLAELEDYGSRARFGTAEPWYLETTVETAGEDMVPAEEKKLLASGKLSSKPMAATKKRELYQDYVCGCALRVARELFALLPVRMALVHATTPLLNRRTGQVEPTHVLSVAFTPSGLNGIAFDKVDPSSAIERFVHRMGFKRSAGFSRIEPLRAEDFRHLEASSR